MKNSSKFLERICKRVRRRTRSSNNKEKKRSDVCTSSKVGSPVDTSRSPSSVATSEKATASWSLELVARGAFQDSKVTVQTRPCPMAAEGICFSSLPARTDSHASSAPLLQVQSPVEEEAKGKSEISGLMSSRQAVLPKTTELLPGKEICMLSATDSGLYSEEEGSEDEYLDVFSEDEEEDVVDDGWLIPADEVSLDKVMTASNSETVYSGYWHGNVAVHARYSNSDESYHSILADVSTLSNIRHESIQLFLGVCHDLHSDYISIIMDQMKGETLHTLIHKRNHKFSFQRLTKIMSQVAQGMGYLHAKGIPHPLLTTHSVTLHFRVCISMLSPGSASMGVVNTTDLPCLSPEVMRTVAVHSSSATHQTGLMCPSSPHSTRGLQSRCSSTTSCRQQPSYRLPSSSTGWSTPSSPSLRHSRRQVESSGFLSPDGPVYSNRGSCDDLRGVDGHCRPRVQLKGEVALMQTFQANIYSFGTLLYEMLTNDKPFTSTPGNLIIYQVGRGSVHSLNSLRDGKLKQTVRRCWRKDPISRPSFQELLSTFEQNLSPKSCGLKSHFSFSVPNQLDKLGRQDSSGCGLNC